MQQLPDMRHAPVQAANAPEYMKCMDICDRQPRVWGLPSRQRDPPRHERKARSSETFHHLQGTGSKSARYLSQPPEVCQDLFGSKLLTQRILEDNVWKLSKVLWLQPLGLSQLVPHIQLSCKPSSAASAASVF